MKSFKARGIVLRESPAGESDKYVDLLLKGAGKLSVSARGARKPSSKFLAGTQPFTYSDFVIYDGGRFFTMSQIDVIEGFYGLRQDYDRLCCGNYFLELCCRAIIPGEECDGILLLLLKSLSALAGGKAPPGLAARVFELKFLQLNGYAPELSACSKCGGGFGGGVFFHADGYVCGGCRPEGAFPVSPGLARALAYILEAGPDRLFSFTAGGGVLAGLKAAADMIFKEHLDVRVKSREMFS